MPDSIRYSIRTQTADSQVPTDNKCLTIRTKQIQTLHCMFNCQFMLEYRKQIYIIKYQKYNYANVINRSLLSTAPYDVCISIVYSRRHLTVS